MPVVDRTGPTVAELCAAIGSDKQSFDRFVADFDKIIAYFNDAVRLLSKQEKRTKKARGWKRRHK